MGRYDMLLEKEQPKPKITRKRVRPAVKEPAQPAGVKAAMDTAPPMIPPQPTAEAVLPVRAVPPVPPVLPVLPVPGKRIMKQRHSFDIYRDQYYSLQELALQDRMYGGIGSMSA